MRTVLLLPVLAALFLGGCAVPVEATDSATAAFEGHHPGGLPTPHRAALVTEEMAPVWMRAATCHTYSASAYGEPRAEAFCGSDSYLVAGTCDPNPAAVGEDTGPKSYSCTVPQGTTEAVITCVECVYE